MPVPLPDLSLGNGNIKVGRVVTFSLPSKLTCPGASSWCLEHCYAFRYERLRRHCGQAYSRNLVLSLNDEEFLHALLQSMPPRLPCLRIHVAGDFYSVGYIESWIEVAQHYPHTLFWSYTRSWVVPSLLSALEELRSLSNVQLFASVDPSMPDPPAHWRKAFIEGDTRATGITCPQQLGSTPSCHACGYCFRGKAGDVVFKVH